MKTQGEIEAAICEGVTRFEQDYVGRGPEDIYAYLLGDLLVVRLRGALTAAEQHLVKSLPAEQVYDAGNGSEAQLNRVRVSRRHAAHSIIEMFAALLNKAARQRLLRINGVVPWPANWTDCHYNGGREPCDTLVGPCSCGAWHTAREDWVQAMLIKHNAEIIDQ
jgi:hypothetical protein